MALETALKNIYARNMHTPTKLAREVAIKETLWTPAQVLQILRKQPPWVQGGQKWVFSEPVCLNMQAFQPPTCSHSSPFCGHHDPRSRFTWPTLPPWKSVASLASRLAVLGFTSTSFRTWGPIQQIFSSASFTSYYSTQFYMNGRA